MAAKAAPEEVPGARSGAKAEPKGGKNASINFLLGPKGKGDRLGTPKETEPIQAV